MPLHSWITRLQNELGQDPGMPSDHLPQAAVLVALDKVDSEPEVILTQRAAHLRLHAGEVAFPGGMCDAEDRDHWATALREAEEEVALKPTNLRRLGVLPAVITRSGIEVTPCVGMLSSSVVLQPNPDELDTVFAAPLSLFADADALNLDAFEYGGRERLVPRYEYQQWTIWGITAAIMVNLVNIACDARLQLENYWIGENDL